MNQFFTQKTAYLITIMVVITLGVLGSAIYLLYQTSFEEQKNRLIATAQSQARFMEAVARFDQEQQVDNSYEATLSQIKEAHKNFKGFGQTGEFTLAKLEANQIVFLLSHRFHDLTEPHPVAFNGIEAEPMRLALQGMSGTLTGLDYRGAKVLAAYEYVQGLNLGVVVKIDLSEVRAPFIRASWLSALIAICLVFIGSWIFQRVSKSMEAQVIASEKLFRDTFSNAAIGLAHVAPDGRWLRVNNALCNMLGYSCDEILKMTFQDVTHPEDLEKDLQRVYQVLADEIQTYSMEKRYIKKDGSMLYVELTVSLVRDVNGKPDYFISAVEDLSELHQSHEKLKAAMGAIKTISGIVPLCAWCGKSIQNEDGEWVRLETYFEDNTEGVISHGMCPSCSEKMKMGIS